MNKPLPRIACKQCFMTQEYRGQQNCIHCGKPMSNWHIATQIAIQGKAQQTNAQN